MKKQNLVMRDLKHRGVKKKSNNINELILILLIMFAVGAAEGIIKLLENII